MIDSDRLWRVPVGKVFSLRYQAILSSNRRRHFATMPGAQAASLAMHRPLRLVGRAIFSLAIAAFMLLGQAHADDVARGGVTVAAATQTEAGVASAPVRTTTDEGVPLAELIDVQVRNVRLRVPAGYLAPWPTQAMRGRLNVVDSLNVNLWMPARRYPEIDPLLLKYQARPKETGRAEPPLYAGVIQVRGLQPVARSESGYVSPDALFQRMTSLAGIDAYSFEAQEFGLDKFWQNNPKRPSLYTVYRRQGADPQALVRCTPDAAAVAERTCLAEIFFTASGLGFYVQFPRYNLPDWLAIVRSVRDLFDSWTYAVEPDRKPLPSSRFDFHAYDTIDDKVERIAVAQRELRAAFPNGSDVHQLVRAIFGWRGMCQRVLLIREIDRLYHKSDDNIYCEVSYAVTNVHISEIYFDWIISVGYSKSNNTIESVVVHVNTF